MSTPLLQDLFKPSLSALNLGIRAVLVYGSVLILLRISGKRQMAQMGTTEFVALLLISNAVQNSMNGGDNSVTGGVWLAVILIFMSWLISLLTYKSRRMRAIFEGVPTLLIHKGKLIKKNLEREKITVQELKTLLRKQGVHSFEEAHTAILEADGTLSITKGTDPEAAFHDFQNLPKL